MDAKVVILMMALAVLQMGVAALQIAREIIGLRRDTQDDDEDAP
jgi:cell division protein FtsL